jgi:hypothetical protein
VLACPKNQRQGNANSSRPVTDLFEYKDIGVDFDYCLVRGVQGARAYNSYSISYLDRKGGFGNGQARQSFTDDQFTPISARFDQLPIFIEESTFFFNADPIYTDGDWAVDDQLTQRHGKQGHILTIDGVARLISPGAGLSETARETADFSARDLYYRFRGGGFDGWLQMGQDPRVVQWAFMDKINR